MRVRVYVMDEYVFVWLFMGIFVVFERELLLDIILLFSSIGYVFVCLNGVWLVCVCVKGMLGNRGWLVFGERYYF